MADETTIPPGPDAPPPFPEPPPSLAAYEEIRLAREPPDARAIRPLYAREVAHKAELLLGRIARAKHEAEAAPPPRFVE